ncbi:MAG: GNAT family N-acetyltransferase [Actinomycetota bacterium]|nr:GNAT family N-acetyltransferase [Actinomycetota bacterium]
MATDTGAVARSERPGRYPASWQVDGLLIDGGPVHVRPLRPEDAAPLIAFHRELSDRTVYYRYFGAHPEFSAPEAAHLVSLDYQDRMAFGAFSGGDLVGVGRYDREARDTAEVAFVVSDAYQRRGVGTLLLEALVGYAAQHRVTTFTAEVLPDNPAMLRVFLESGLAVTTATGEDAIDVTIALADTPAYLDRRDERERASQAASMASVLRPGSVAVVGAGRAPGGVGHAIVRGLLAGDFAGTVFPVNPHARSVCGVLAYPSLTAVPGPVDLAVVAVQARQVADVARDAAAAGVRALVIVSAGFAELGDEGRAAQTELLAIARSHGIRVVGPNCLGVLNTAPDVRCDATFAPGTASPGPIAIASQSGAVGVVLLDEARRAGLGISSFVSVGNKIDVSGNDLLCYWERDDATRVVAMYLESFGNPRKFARIARRVARTKPVVVLKGGRSAAGARGAMSHTAAAATPEVAVGALLAASGVIEVSRLEELIDVVGVLATNPLPRGGRVALVGNSGGPLILAADACVAEGLEVPELSASAQSELAPLVPPASAVGNPVDITADGTAETLERVLSTVVSDDGVDAAIVVVTALNALPAADARRALERVAARSLTPVVACVLGADGTPPPSVGEPGTVVLLPSPERAAGAVAKIAAYAAWRATPEEDPEELPGFDLAAARSIVTAELERSGDGGWLDAGTAAELLGSLGIPTVGAATVDSLEAALDAARRLGYPVALKAGSGSLVHKSDAGGVALDLADDEALERAYSTMLGRLADAMHPAVVETMASPGVETIVGVTSEPHFGPLLLFGLGGVATDLLNDRAFAVPPLSRSAAQRLVTSIRTAPLLTGYRGSAPVDLPALVDVVSRVSRLASEVPEISELDLNPVVASPSGAVAVDWKIRIAPVPRGPDALMRVLRS